MKRKSLLISILSIILAFSSVFFVGCGDNGGGENPSTGGNNPSQSAYSLLFDDVALLNGQSLDLDAKLLADGKLVEALITYESSDASVVSISGGVATAKKLGSVTITATASFGGKETVAKKQVSCTVAISEGIVPDAHSYTLYISDEVHGVAYDTAKTVNAEVYSAGNKVVGADVEWTIADSSIATLDANGTLKAVKIGKTYIEGTYGELKTLQIPVEVVTPVLNTDINVVVDTREVASVVDANVVLGNGKTIGRVVNVETGSELTVNNNAISTSGLKVGEYRYTFYDKGDFVGCEVNLIVADYVVNNKADFQNLAYNAKAKYVAFTSDLINVGDYSKTELVSLPAEETTFKGVLNGLGHKIEGLNVVTNAYGLFGKANGAVFKNISFTNTKIAASNVGIFFFQSSGEVTFDNVFVEVDEFASDSWSSGALFGFNYNGKMTIKNSIVKVEGKAVQPNDKGVTYCGAITGRAKTIPVFENTYIISSGGIIAANGIVDPHSKVFDKINVLPIIYNSDQAFIDARNAFGSAIDLSGFADFWNLTEGVPCFK